MHQPYVGNPSFGPGWGAFDKNEIKTVSQIGCRTFLGGVGVAAGSGVMVGGKVMSFVKIFYVREGGGSSSCASKCPSASYG